MISLDRQKALDLLPKVIDGEVTPAEHRRFFSYLRQDELVRKKFESHQKLKMAICCRCKREKAPDHLRQRIMRMIADSG